MAVFFQYTAYLSQPFSRVVEVVQGAHAEGKVENGIAEQHIFRAGLEGVVVEKVILDRLLPGDAEHRVGIVYPDNGTFSDLVRQRVSELARARADVQNHLIALWRRQRHYFGEQHGVELGV